MRCREASGIARPCGGARAARAPCHLLTRARRGAARPAARNAAQKVDGRVRALIEAGVASGHRSLLVVVGDGGREQVSNLHYMLSKAQVKARPSVLWCYKKELGFSSHKRKRMAQIKKKAGKVSSGAAAAAADEGGTDPFELFISSTEITYTYYKDSARILGRTFGMAVLQDFEALTPNVLARTVETVCGGGLVVLLLGKLSSLRQLHDLAMDAHARLRTPSSGAVVPRFNGRFLLSLADCPACLLLDDELNVLPLSSHAHAMRPAAAEPAAGAAGASAAKVRAAAELSETIASLRDVPIAGTLLPLCRSADQAKAVLTVADALADKTLRQTVALTAGRGRGKSAALGLALAAAVGSGFANIFVTAPALENVQTVFEFALKGLDALSYTEHADYSVREAQPAGERGGGGGGGGGGDGGDALLGDGGGSRSSSLRCVSRIDVFRSHRQTILYVRPDDALAVRHAEMVVIDEAAAIPLPIVRALLGPYLCVLSSTVSGYEGTGRALSLKLIKGLRDKAATDVPGAGGGARSLREVSLAQPIRYEAADPIEAWLHALLCLDAATAVKPVLACPHPSACELYLVERDALFSYQRASEAFLQRVVGLLVGSHYKNSPNDLLLLADAPAHALFALLAPTAAGAAGEARLPDVLAVVQIAYEGQLGREMVREGAGRGIAPSGDLLPWTVSTQFQDADFAALSGGRIVRIATHPDLCRMGYGSRALQLLRAFFSGQIPTDEARGGEGEATAPPPLLRRLSEVGPPRGGLDYMGASFGCGYDLLQFWRKAGFAPVYLRQQPNDTTGEHSLIVLTVGAFARAAPRRRAAPRLAPLTRAPPLAGGSRARAGSDGQRGGLCIRLARRLPRRLVPPFHESVQQRGARQLCRRVHGPRAAAAAPRAQAGAAAGAGLRMRALQGAARRAALALRRAAPARLCSQHGECTTPSRHAAMLPCRHAAMAMPRGRGDMCAYHAHHPPPFPSPRVGGPPPDHRPDAHTRSALPRPSAARARAALRRAAGHLARPWPAPAERGRRRECAQVARAAAPRALRKGRAQAGGRAVGRAREGGGAGAAARRCERAGRRAHAAARRRVAQRRAARGRAARSRRDAHARRGRRRRRGARRCRAARRRRRQRRRGGCRRRARRVRRARALCDPRDRR